MTPAELKAAGWKYDRAILSPIHSGRGSYHCWARGMWRIATQVKQQKYDHSVHACVSCWAYTLTVSGFATRTAALDNLGRLDAPNVPGVTVREWALSPP